MRKLLIAFLSAIALFATSCEPETPPVPPNNPPGNPPSGPTYSTYKVYLSFTKGNTGINDVQMSACLYTYDTLNQMYMYNCPYSQSWLNNALSGHYEEIDISICDTTTAAFIEARVKTSTPGDYCEVSIYKNGILLVQQANQYDALITFYPNQ